MKLTIHDVAKLLGIPELTIQRWIRQGKIPAVHARGEFYFIKKDVKKWAQAHHIFLDTAPETERAPEKLQQETFLFDAMSRGGTFFHLKGKSVSDVLREAVGLASLPENTDREFLLEMLLQREKLASTGIGSGIAFPHPRYPLETFQEQSLITTCFLDTPVDFHAMDGIPVFVIFLLLSSNTKIHLNVLSRLSFCLKDLAFTAFLKKCSNPQEFLARIKEKEVALARK